MFDAAVEIVAELSRIIRRNRRARQAFLTVAVLVAASVVWKAVAWTLRPGVAVSGWVTVQGRPLESGLISFHVVMDGGNGPPAAGAAIQDGHYAVGVGGLVPGRYVVQVRSTQPSDADGENGTAPPGQERLSAEFNDRSRLEVEVSRFGRNRFDFDVR